MRKFNEYSPIRKKVGAPLKALRKIEFTWSGQQFKGTIVGQIPSSILGQQTIILTDTGKFTIYGKIALGNCGPLTVTKLY